MMTLRELDGQVVEIHVEFPTGFVTMTGRVVHLPASGMCSIAGLYLPAGAKITEDKYGVYEHKVQEEVAA